VPRTAAFARSGSPRGAVLRFPRVSRRKGAQAVGTLARRKTARRTPSSNLRSGSF
jgi:hypothetical protein